MGPWSRLDEAKGQGRTSVRRRALLVYEVLEKETPRRELVLTIATSGEPVEAVREIMGERRMLLDRGEKLDALNDKADGCGATAFRQQARQAQAVAPEGKVKWGVAVGTLVTAWWRFRLPCWRPHGDTL